jgi:type II secretory pathway component PulM
MHARVAPSMPPPLARWWSARSPSERRRLARVATVVAAVFAVIAVAQPLMRSADATREATMRDASALVEARARVAEVASLSKAGVPVAGDARSELERALAQSGLREAVTQLDWQQGRARVTFAEIGFEPLVRMLEALQRDARLRVIDAKLTARVEAGSVRAELTLGR